jgi:ATP-dependent DNA helicase RecQ
MADPVEVLRRVFGHPAFRGEQQAIVEHVAAGGDAIVLMPTGGGKSVCYQVPALVRDGVAVVVSPLIALMQDQVDALKELGVAAAFLNSSLAPDAAAGVERATRDGAVKLLYVAPERLLTPRFLALLDALRDAGRLALFAIDEAHCVSQWGHDFRSEYLRLSVLPERYPGTPRIALTATADATTRQEIRDRLGLEAARELSPASTAPTSATRSPSATTSGHSCLRSLPGTRARRALSTACRGARSTPPRRGSRRRDSLRCPITPAWMPTNGARTRRASCARTA